MFGYFPIRVPEVVERSRGISSAVLGERTVAGAFLAGAPMAGLGTLASDTDLFVITHDEPETSNEQFMLGTSRVDVRYWSAAALEGLVERVGRFRFSEEDGSHLAETSRRTIDPVIRFRYSEIVADDGTLDRLLTRIDLLSPQIVRALAVVLAVEVNVFAEDAYGFHSIGDLHGLRHVSALALFPAAEAYLASAGDPYLGSKWVWAKWERSASEVLGVHARRIIMGDDGDITANDRLWLSQDLLIHAQSNVLYEDMPARPGMPWRDPFATPIVTTTAALIYRPCRKPIRLSSPGLLLWGVAHGRSRADAVSTTWALLSQQGLDVTTESVDAYYDTLIKIGLVHEDNFADA